MLTWARTQLAHLLGTDHRPSKCAITAGEYVAAMFAHDLIRSDGGDPGPKPVYVCACPCQDCQRGRCDLDPWTAAEVQARRFLPKEGTS